MMKFRYRRKARSGSKSVAGIIAIVILMQLFFAQKLDAQKNYQAWVEYIPTISLPKSFSLELRGAYRTDFEESRWHTYEFRTQPEYKLNKYVTFIGVLDLVRTHQYEHLTTFEVREALGVNLSFTPKKRIHTGLHIKGEQRNVQDLETKDWNSSTRLRILASVKSPLNKKSMSADKVLYALAEIEFFIDQDDDIQERYANEMKVYGGMGYKIIHNLKLELVYVWQESRNTIYGDVSSAQNIFRLRVLQHIGGKKKPTPDKPG